MKRAGFLFGAVVAALAVTLFNMWRHVSDDDRLALVLADHCLPYVTTGAEPFTDLGRSPGVYDEVDLRDNVTDGGAVLLFDNRFTAQWGLITGGGRTSRICDVHPTYGTNTVSAFEVDEDGFISRYTEILSEFGPLMPDIETLTDGPRTVGWFEPNSIEAQGLRAVFVASPGLVSSIIVGDDVPQ